MYIFNEMRDSSRRVFPSCADDVVNFYAEALTLAAPAALNAGDERPISAFFAGHPVRASGRDARLPGPRRRGPRADRPDDP